MHHIYHNVVYQSVIVFSFLYPISYNDIQDSISHAHMTYIVYEDKRLDHT